MVEATEDRAFGALTVGELANRLFPRGTQEGSWQRWAMPALPTDIFAFVAVLIERAGLYHKLVRDVGGEPSPDWASGANALHIAPDDHAEWMKLGREWRRLMLGIGKAPTEDARKALRELRIEIDKALWSPLQGRFDDLVRRHDGSRADWEKFAAGLLVIADEACSGLGYEGTEDDATHPIEALIRARWSTREARTEIVAGSRHYRVAEAPMTFAIRADPTVARVLPKSRTPSVGCTMRALTHNLALAPPTGVVDLLWHRQAGVAQRDREPMNILMAPLPFRISARNFVAGAAASPEEDGRAARWFHLEQSWLRPPKPSASRTKPVTDPVVAFLWDLIVEARRDVRRVDGLLLPELALDWRTHAALVSHALEHSSPDSHLGFIVSGSSSDCAGRAGNFVLVTTFSVENGELTATTSARAKHHRWRLTGQQIEDYALSDALDPNTVWWEGMALPERQIGLTVFRQSAIFSAMICEDLARSEPCHEPLRSVGPNLVFVLLMDGPQLPHRWSARYSTILADDPGSSVLTLTSLGLIARCNAAGRHTPNHDIGLWKDDTGRTVSLACPPGIQGVVVTLSGHAATDRTLDWRAASDAQSWRYAGHQPVQLSREKREAHRRILEGEQDAA